MNFDYLVYSLLTVALRGDPELGNDEDARFALEDWVNAAEMKEHSAEDRARYRDYLRELGEL
jgi:hypothetical protein